MFNQCTFFGRLATEPSIHTTTTDKKVCSFRFAVPVLSKSDEKNADFFTMEAWGVKATLISEHLKKGDRVLLSTRARQKSYTDKDGQKRTEIVFVVSEIVFAGDKKPEAAQEEGDAYLSDDDDTQLPFDLEEPEEDPA